MTPALRFASLSMAFMLMVWASVAFPQTAEAQGSDSFCVKDDLGRKVCTRIPKKDPIRVVSLAPHLTETIYFLGAGPRVVAVDRSSDYPKEVQQLPKVGDSLRLDLERVIALKPDLVLAWASGTSQTQINQLQKLGIPVFVSEPLSVEAIASTMRRISVLLGLEAEKKLEIDQWVAAFNSLGAHKQKVKVRVFYQVWHDPLMTLSGKHVVSEIIQKCGGSTAFSEARLLAPTVSLESVLQFNPQLILATSEPSSLVHWTRWSSMAAVRNKQLKVVTPDILVRSGPRILQAAREVCALVQEAGQSQ
ncbi:MAG: cobalamin-binding protein [Limnobacter sp.]|nr:cobalamin-binding protein [Limnobacter sp.]